MKLLDVLPGTLFVVHGMGCPRDHAGPCERPTTLPLFMRSHQGASQVVNLASGTRFGWIDLHDDVLTDPTAWPPDARAQARRLLDILTEHLLGRQS